MSSKPNKSPMTKEAAANIAQAAQKNPQSKSAKDGFAERAKDAANKNSKK
jgi:hypothetical protein